MSNTNTIFEILKWRPKFDVSDEQMTSAVNLMVGDLTQPPGFLHQSLYNDGYWVEIYYWETEKMHMALMKP